MTVAAVVILIGTAESCWMNSSQAWSRRQARFDEIIVVDNGSTDGSAGMLDDAGAKVVRAAQQPGIRRRGESWN